MHNLVCFLARASVLIFRLADSSTAVRYIELA